ncbi:MAG: M20/M25/M40 family metallo-hydrolase [Corticimicrobacter sp.]|uniref:M20/M25/M40 family metallo-hydrolase n=1 Tax=Corticimicrobacter sp. TaxID=2678536 RepID=UPI0032D9C932
MAKKLLDLLDKAPGEAIEWHRQLLCRKAINPEHGGQGEEKKARWIEHWLRNNGLCEIKRIDSLDTRLPRGLRPNLLARYRPPRSTHMLWIITHMDTAASGPLEHWHGDPFSLRIDGDRLYGRGVEDNNQAIVSALLLLDAIKQLAPAHRPRLGLGLICVSAGLTDYTKGLDVILQKYPRVFHHDDLIVVPDYGNPQGALIEISEKRSMWLRIDVRGDAYHAGYENKANAFDAACHFISQLDPIRQRFAAADPHYTPSVSTITATHCETSCTGLNHVAAHFAFYLDIRLMPGCSIPALMASLQQLSASIAETAGVTFDFGCIEVSPDAAPTPQDASIIRHLSTMIETELGITPRMVGVGGVTMVSVIRALGLPVAVWSIQGGNKIKANESVSLSAQLAQTRILGRLLYLRKSQLSPMPGTSHTLEPRLTPAQAAVARLLGEGQSNKQLTTSLGISENTVRTHIKQIYRATGLHSREELRRLCQTWG